MENEKSVYEILQEQIKRQDKIINKLIKSNVITILILAVVMIVFTLSYFFADYNCYNNTGENYNYVNELFTEIRKLGYIPVPSSTGFESLAITKTNFI